MAEIIPFQTPTVRAEDSPVETAKAIHACLGYLCSEASRLGLDMSVNLIGAARIGLAEEMDQLSRSDDGDQVRWLSRSLPGGD